MNITATLPERRRRATRTPPRRLTPREPILVGDRPRRGWAGSAANLAPTPATRGVRAATTARSRGDEPVLVVVTGPPFSGVGVLSERLAEELPRAVRIDAVRAEELPDGTTVRSGDGNGDEEVISMVQARRRAKLELGSGKNVVLCARFASRAERRRLRALAQRVGVAHLLVEVGDVEDDVVEELAEVADSPQHLRELLHGFEPVDARERRTGPVITVDATTPADEQCSRVLDRWGYRDAVH